MRRAYAPALAGLLLGCAVHASTQPREDTAAPAAAETPAVAPAGAAEDAAAGGAPAEPAAADLTASEPGELAAARGGEPPQGPERGVTDEPAQASPSAGDAPVTRLELPKPLHTRLDAACGKDPGVGERLRSFSLPGIEGAEPVTPGTFRGRVLVVNFWGTWCKPCLEELPEFDQLYRRYRKHGMTLLAIATDEDAQAVKELVTKRKLGAKIALAGEAYAGQYGSPKFPFTFVVDHKGVIQASYRGYKPECLGQLEADIRAQLEARAEAKTKAKKG
jgi:thiol-disulfide isomerase/thioredoxin